MAGVLKLGMIVRDRGSLRMGDETVVRASIENVAPRARIELIVALLIVDRVGRLSTGFAVRTILLRDETIVELKDRVGWIATTALWIAVPAGLRLLRIEDRAAHHRDMMITGWKDHAGWIVTTDLRIAVPAGLRLLRTEDRAAHHRNEMVTGWKKHAA